MKIFHESLEGAVAVATAASAEFVIEVEHKTDGRRWIVSEMGIYRLREAFARQPWGRVAEGVARVVAEHRVEKEIPTEAGHWIHAERNRGVRNLNSDF